MDVFTSFYTSKVGLNRFDFNLESKVMYISKHVLFIFIIKIL